MGSVLAFNSCFTCNWRISCNSYCCYKAWGKRSRDFSCEFDALSAKLYSTGSMKDIAETALKVLQETVARDPMDIPAPPAYPDKSKPVQ